MLLAPLLTELTAIYRSNRLYLRDHMTGWNVNLRDHMTPRLECERVS